MSINTKFPLDIKIADTCISQFMHCPTVILGIPMTTIQVWLDTLASENLQTRPVNLYLLHTGKPILDPKTLQKSLNIENILLM